MNNYQPKPGSHAETLVRAILKAPGAVRSGELAKATGIPVVNIGGTLEAAIRAGLISCCKVTIGKDVLREYRAGPGQPATGEKTLTTPLAGRPIIPVRGVSAWPPVSAPVDAKSTDQPAVSHNTGSAPSSPPQSLPLLEGRAVATEVVPKAPSGWPWNPPTQPAAGDVTPIEIHINQNGALFIGTADEEVELCPAHTLALGDFLHGTQALWRP